ncbi:MAG: glycoside hydrolase family 15 protein [archaeon]
MKRLKKVIKKKRNKKDKILNYNELIKQHLKVLKNLQYKSGLFAASKKGVETGYDKAWLRDNFYECLAFEVIGDWKTVRKTYRSILDIFKKHESKIDYAIAKKPEHTYQYIHPRYHPETFDEYWEEWGNKQNDSIGCILFKIGELEHNKSVKLLRNERDRRIVQKLVNYLSTLHYWHDPDSGIWEENQEVHASSVGACLAGLKMIKNIKGIYVSDELIKRGEEVLNTMLPRESEKKFVDLSLLSLIWPYDIVNEVQRDEIIKNVEYHLLRKKGIIRYKNDKYYNKNPDGYSEEAEWTFGLSWLSIIYDKIGNEKKAKLFLKRALKTVTPEGEIPELYFSNSKIYNKNTPLGWSESLFIVALYDINKKHIK